MSIGTKQSSYGYKYGFYDSHRESSSDIQNESNFFQYELFIPPPLYGSTIRRDQSTYIGNYFQNYSNKIF